MTFGLRVDQIDASVLDRLRDDSVCEGRHLEFKEKLPGQLTEDKKEFLADVTAFANTGGGDLLYGVREKRDAGDKPTGEIQDIPGLADLNFDAERTRLENILLNGVEPRLPPINLSAYRARKACLVCWRVSPVA